MACGNGACGCDTASCVGSALGGPASSTGLGALLISLMCCNRTYRMCRGCGASGLLASVLASRRGTLHDATSLDLAGVGGTDCRAYRGELIGFNATLELGGSIRVTVPLGVAGIALSSLSFGMGVNSEALACACTRGPSGFRGNGSNC